jgi:hypothetical protein
MLTVTLPPLGVPAVTLTDRFDGAADAAAAVMARSEALRSTAKRRRMRRDVFNGYVLRCQRCRRRVPSIALVGAA